MLALIAITITITMAIMPTARAETTVLQTIRAGPTNLPFHMVASVIDASTDLTTYALQCPSSASTEPFCPLPTPVTLTEGPSAASISIFSSVTSSGMHAAITVLQDCSLTSTSLTASPTATVSGSRSGPDSALDCFWSYSLDMTASDGSSHTTNQASRTQLVGSQVSYAPLTVTAGVDKLRAPKATQTADAAAPAGAGAGAGVGVGTGVWGAAGAAVLAGML